MSQTVAGSRSRRAQRSAPPGNPGNARPDPGSAPGGARPTLAPAGGRRELVARSFEGTPGRLRLASVVVVLACAVFALLAASAFQARGNALDQAREDAAQLVRIQQIATSVVKADSLFTNGYLAYGLESTDQLNEYDKAIALASTTIADASQANPADAAQLARVNQALTLYTARVAAARSNNALGYPVATGYLRQAANLLRSQQAGQPDMLPTLNQLIDANTGRVNDAYSSSNWATLRLAVAALLVLAGLGVVQVWLARLTHRWLNVQLAAATVAVLVVLVTGTVVMVNAQSRANDVRNGAYASTLDLALARINAFTAKSQESISLIYLGTGGGYAEAEKSFQDSVGRAKTQLQRVTVADGSNPGRAQISAWEDVHKKIYAQAQTDWTGAAKAASAKAGGGNLNDTFKQVDTATGQALDDKAEDVRTGLTSSHVPLVVLGWITLVVGLIAAGAAWAGVSRRLEEYR